MARAVLFVAIVKATLANRMPQHMKPPYSRVLWDWRPWLLALVCLAVTGGSPVCLTLPSATSETVVGAFLNGTIVSGKSICDHWVILEIWRLDS